MVKANQLKGAINRAQGQSFERLLEISFEYYRRNGLAEIDKTPEPMRPIQSLSQGRFIACFEKKAQPDYKGTLRGGQTVIFEAKYTSTERMEQSRILPVQGEYMDRVSLLGAQCYVLAGFGSGRVYRLPWEVWRGMKEHFGRKYITENDLEKYRVAARNGILLLLN